MARNYSGPNVWPSVIGLILLVIWVGVCAVGFWLVLELINADQTSESIAALIWPFVIILIAVPILAILLIGGLRIVGEVLSLKSFLDDLPGHVTVLGDLAGAMRKHREYFEAANTEVQNAASAIEQSTSQLADVGARLRVGQQDRAQADIALDQPDDLVTRLGRHLEATSQKFDRAAKRHAEDEGQGVKRVSGWILDDSVDELLRTGYLTASEAAYIKAVLDVDRRTRRSSRANLSNEDVRRLDELSGVVDA